MVCVGIASGNIVAHTCAGHRLNRVTRAALPRTSIDPYLTELVEQALTILARSSRSSLKGSDRSTRKGSPNRTDHRQALCVSHRICRPVPEQQSTYCKAGGRSKKVAQSIWL